MLKVATASVLDPTEDGSRVAVAVRRLEDNAETDHRRYGDPTYVTSSMVELVVFDTRSGVSEKPFKQLISLRQAAWSRDGARLAVPTTTEARCAADHQGDMGRCPTRSDGGAPQGQWCDRGNFRAGMAA